MHNRTNSVLALPEGDQRAGHGLQLVTPHRSRPVEGWEAKETTLKGSDYYHGKNYTTIIQSYVIRACPLFLPDEKNEPPRIYRKWIVEVDGEWLTTQETRERLGIDRREIYKLIERGKLNARQVEQMS